MPSYHAEADKEIDFLLRRGNRDLKRALGMMIQRHVRIDAGTEPFSLAELLPSSGPSLQPMHSVAYSVNLAEVVVVYETTTSDTTALAVDAWYMFARFGPPGASGDAVARAWSRAS